MAVHVRRWVSLALATAGLAAGGGLWLAGRELAPELVWVGVTAGGIVAGVWWVTEAARHRRLGADVVAVVAMAGAIAVGEPLAGALVAVMLFSGRALEAFATARAHRELSALVARTPRVAHRHQGATRVEVPVEEVQPGDVLVVAAGEVVPVDGLVVGGDATLDESALTGEALPVVRPGGGPVRSGTVNAGEPFDLRATSGAATSTYAGIVRLAEEAERSRSPFVRTADRYAGVFLAVSLAVAGLAWLVTGDPVRAVAVLVVATPCPLILAVPMAMVAGLSTAARRGVIVKGGEALERLADGRVLLFDKTGTLTEGHPSLVEVVGAPGVDRRQVLHLAASLEQVSSHVLAAAVVQAARTEGVQLSWPTAATERAGWGLVGQVDGARVAVGQGDRSGPAPAPGWVRAVERRAAMDGALAVFVTSDDVPAGALVFEDPIRLDAPRTIRRLRESGIERIVMVTGDRADVAETVGVVIGVDEVRAERTPADKVAAVRLESEHAPTIMVGDGINDAPALAAAGVGVALGARGSSASSEAADVVISVDRLDRVADAITIGRRTRRIATQSALGGIGLSVVAMGAAAFGLLPPAWGALLQEAIDVLVILNALRVLRTQPAEVVLTQHQIDLAHRFEAEHERLAPHLDRIRRAADQIGTTPPPEALAATQDAVGFLTDELQPHEEAEETDLYPAMASALGGVDPMGAMTRSHVEITRLIRRLRQLVDSIDPDDPPTEDLMELRRVLYGLDAILRLHFAQEDERYLSLADGSERGRQL